MPPMILYSTSIGVARHSISIILVVRSTRRISKEISVSCDVCQITHIYITEGKVDVQVFGLNRIKPRT